MNVITLYAECELPEVSRIKQRGFDWRKAIEWLEKSASKQGYKTHVVTDTKTNIDASVRVGDARKSGLMKWILEAQTEAIRQASGPSVMVSPDSLVMGPLDTLFGGWDVVLLTRRKPKPIVNSVIAFQPSDRLARLWQRMAAHSKCLDAKSLEWGADIDALVSYMNISQSENCTRMIDDVRVRFMPMEPVFTSVSRSGARANTPIWDFKGSRKSLMAQHARAL